MVKNLQKYLAIKESFTKLLWEFKKYYGENEEAVLEGSKTNWF